MLRMTAAAYSVDDKTACVSNLEGGEMTARPFGLYAVPGDVLRGVQHIGNYSTRELAEARKVALESKGWQGYKFVVKERR